MLWMRMMAKRGQRRLGRAQHGALWIAVILAAVITVAVGALVRGKSFIVVSVLMVIYCMVPFFVSFERRRPQARELVMVVVMVALAVVSRTAFAWLPHFKPMAAVIMVAGIALGPSTGFVVGALSALVSSFVFGLGPWTPWQMLSFGTCGVTFGALAKAGAIPQQGWSWRTRVLVGVAGAAFVIFVAGPILDTSSVFLMLSRVTPEGVIAVYAAGLPVNAMQGAATFLTLLFAGSPLLDRLARVRARYGMMDT